MRDRLPHMAAPSSYGSTFLIWQVPEGWSALWEGPEALGAAVWMRAAVNRLEALQRWAGKARDGSLLGAPLRLDELLHAAFFLTALRQQTARQARLPYMAQQRLPHMAAPPI